MNRLQDLVLGNIRASSGEFPFADDLSIASFSEFKEIDPVEIWDSRKDLEYYGVELVGKPNRFSRIIVDKNAQPATTKFKLQMEGQAHSVIVLSSTQKLVGHIRLTGDYQTVLIGNGGSRPFHVNSAVLRGQGALLAVGADCTSNGVNLTIDGDETFIAICDNCMLSHQIDINASDSHGIFDLGTLETINPPASVVIGRHVWLGAHSTVLKGVRIGQGSIVGSGSVVTHDVPPTTLVAGVPAKVVRVGVTWTVERSPNREAKELVRDLLLI